MKTVGFTGIKEIMRGKEYQIVLGGELAYTVSSLSEAFKAMENEVGTSNPLNYGFEYLIKGKQ